MKHNFTVRHGALDGVEAFLNVAKRRSFRGAAAELGVTPSAISQAVRALEARIGAALFIRTTRSVGLTEAGNRFLSRAKPAFEEAVEVVVSGPFIANDIPTMLGAAAAGLGLAQVPGPIAAGAVTAGKLVSVLEPFAPMAPGVFLYYPGNRQMTPKLRAFIDHVKGRSDAAHGIGIDADDRRAGQRRRA
jgi:DNA-binding transcriptional LysR family regulator